MGLRLRPTWEGLVLSSAPAYGELSAFLSGAQAFLNNEQSSEALAPLSQSQMHAHPMSHHSAVLEYPTPTPRLMYSFRDPPFAPLVAFPTG